VIRNEVALHVRAVDKWVFSIVREVTNDSKIVTEACGKALQLGVESAKDRATCKEPAPKLASQAHGPWQPRGLLTNIGGIRPMWHDFCRLF
jgi:hypothetical protein